MVDEITGFPSFFPTLGDSTPVSVQENVKKAVERLLYHYLRNNVFEQKDQDLQCRDLHCILQMVELNTMFDEEAQDTLKKLQSLEGDIELAGKGLSQVPIIASYIVQDLTAHNSRNRLASQITQIEMSNRSAEKAEKMEMFKEKLQKGSLGQMEAEQICRDLQNEE